MPVLVSTSFAALGVVAFILESTYTLLWLFGLLVWRAYGGEAGRARFDQLQIGRLSFWKKITGVGVWVLTPLYWLYVAKYFESIDAGYKYSIVNLSQMMMIGAFWLFLSLGLLAYAKWRYKRSSARAGTDSARVLVADRSAVTP
jgi:hypothetical protein